MSRQKAAAPFVLVTVFLDMLSIGIMVPVLPKLIEQFTGSVSQAGWWLGAFGALWGLAQFIFSPIQGGLSDRFGRRPVILGSNLGLGLDYLLMALAPNLWWLLIGRVINGITSASISTAYAYMSDVSPPEKRAQTFGMMGAAFGVGFVVGPTAAGFLGEIDLHLPFYLAAALSLTNFLYGVFVLPESLPPENRKPFSVNTSNPFGSIGFLARLKVLRLSGMNLLISFAHTVLPTTFVLYAGYRHNWGLHEVSLTLAAVGILSAIVQAGLVGRFAKWIGEKNTAILGLACGTIGFLGYGFAPTPEIMLVFLPIQCLWGMAGPSIQALMTARIPPQDQGTLQGANMSVMALSNIVAPLAFGFVLSVVTRPDVPLAFSGSAFALASLCVFLALLLALGVKQTIKHEPEISSPTS